MLFVLFFLCSGWQNLGKWTRLPKAIWGGKKGWIVVLQWKEKFMAVSAQVPNPPIVVLRT